MDNPIATESDVQRLVAELYKIPVFADSDAEHLEWFVSQSTERRLEPGEIAFHEGAPADTMVVFLSGKVFSRRESAGSDSPIYVAQTGDVTGMLPFSRMKEVTVTGRAETPVHLLLFPANQFPEMLHRMPLVGQRLVGVLTDRVREVTRGEQLRDKLAALGKLSAGLAHELNNPAAAAARASDALLGCIARLRELDAQPYLTGTNCSAIAAAEAGVRAQLQPAAFQDDLDRSDREESLNHWLEQHHVEEPWKLSPALAGSNFTTDHLEIFQSAAGDALRPALLRFATLLEMESLTNQLANSTKRISSLVKAIKEYSYMDQSPVQEIDILRGIETTLTILEHKLRKGITVTRDFASSLPHIWANGSELNQIWTNLIDNAADAMNGKGTLQIRAQRQGDDLVVEFVDSGAGIPKELQSRIFEPFFTTKPVGGGTGLGLDAVHRIVRKLHGAITFTSVPGETCFQVRIPFHRSI